MKEIKIQELENIKIGSAENKDAATGCTVPTSLLTVMTLTRHTSGPRTASMDSGLT